jgi:hypothetical protein
LAGAGCGGGGLGAIAAGGCGGIVCAAASVIEYSAVKATKSATKKMAKSAAGAARGLATFIESSPPGRQKANRHESAQPWREL